MTLRPPLAPDRIASIGMTCLLAAACTPTPAPSQPAPTDGSGGGMIATTPEPTSPPSSDGGPCTGQFFPVVQGVYWEYEGSTISGDFGRRGGITDAADDSFLVQGSIEDPDSDVAFIEAWQCTAEGLIQLQSEGIFSAVLRGADDTVELNTISTEGITVPPAMEVGDEWDQTTVLGVTTSAVSTQVTLAHEFSIGGAETISVPAGTFQTFRVDVNSSMDLPLGEPFEYESTQWWAAGVGLVKFEGDVPDGDGSFAVDYQLTAFTHP